jgi:hypothetical protein
VKCSTCEKEFGPADTVYRTRVEVCKPKGGEKTVRVWMPGSPRDSHHEYFEGRTIWVSGRQAPVCETCRPTDAYFKWSDPQPCAGCGRPLRSSFTREGKGARTCSHWCWCAVEAAKRRQERQQRGGVQHAVKACAVCNVPFIPTRNDAVVCSHKCRQKAYRQRQHA